MNNDKVEKLIRRIKLYSEKIKEEYSFISERNYVWSDEHRATIPRRTIDMKNACTELKNACTELKKEL